MEELVFFIVGSAAGLIAALVLPFLGAAVARNKEDLERLSDHGVRDADRIEELSKIIDMQGERIDFLSESIDNAGKAFERLHVQLDGVESDLERHKLSSLSKVSAKTGTFKLNVPVKKARKTLDKIKQSGVQSAVVKNATKQGGKRANKSRNR